MILRAKHWRDIEALGTWIWPRFSLEKMACSHCGSIEIDSDFMDRLSALREEFGQPMLETSGYRCPDHNARISSTGRTGPHTTGQAVDIAIYGESAYRMIELAFKHGFTGIGIRQRGRHSGRFVHLDDLASEQAPRPRVWSY